MKYHSAPIQKYFIIIKLCYFNDSKKGILDVIFCYVTIVLNQAETYQMEEDFLLVPGFTWLESGYLYIAKLQ